MNEYEQVQSEIDDLIESSKNYKPMQYNDYADFFRKTKFYALIRGFSVILGFLIFVSLIVVLILCTLGVFDVGRGFFYITSLILFLIIPFSLFKFLDNIMGRRLELIGLNYYFDLNYYDEIDIKCYSEIENICVLNKDFKMIVARILEFRQGVILTIDYEALNTEQIAFKYKRLNSINKHNEEKNNILLKIKS